jgi:hypothetical protein
MSSSVDDLAREILPAWTAPRPNLRNNDFLSVQWVDVALLIRADGLVRMPAR